MSTLEHRILFHLTDISLKPNMDILTYNHINPTDFFYIHTCTMFCSYLYHCLNITSEKSVSILKSTAIFHGLLYFDSSCGCSFNFNVFNIVNTCKDYRMKCYIFFLADILNISLRSPRKDKKIDCLNFCLLHRSLELPFYRIFCIGC